MSISDQYQSMTCINGSVFGDLWDWHGVVLVHVHILYECVIDISVCLCEFVMG